MEKLNNKVAVSPLRPLIGCAVRPEAQPILVWESFREWMLKPRRGKSYKPYRKNQLVAIAADGQKFLANDGSNAWDAKFPVRVYLRRDIE